MRTSRSRHARLVVFTLLISTGISAGCNNGSTAPTPTLSTENFTGTVAVSGSDSKRFTVNYALVQTDASITVTALTTAEGAPVATTIGVAFGSIAFDGSCTAASSLTASAATIGQELVASASFIGPFQYCFKIFDSGTLTEPTNYAVTVKHY